MDNVAVVTRYLRNRLHLTPAQAAGVVGSLQQESGPDLSPTAQNSSSGALGIAQWLGGRKSALLAKGNPTSLSTQLDHLRSELEGPESSALNRLRQTHSAGEAAKVFTLSFERPGASEANMPARVANANSVLGLAKNTGGDGGSDTSSSTGRNGSPSTPDITVGGGVSEKPDPEAEKRVILANLIKQRDPQSLLLKLGILDPNESTTKTVTEPGVTIPGVRGSNPSGSRSSSGSSGSSSGGVKGGKSPLFELIHKGAQPFAVKDGKKVDPSFYSAVWDNHAGHVHVAAGPNTVVKLGRLAQRMGLHVGENPHFGGVNPVHSKNSYHYKGEAIDVSGDPKKMDQYAARVERIFGIH